MVRHQSRKTVNPKIETKPLAEWYALMQQFECDDRRIHPVSRSRIEPMLDVLGSRKRARDHK